MERSSSLRHGGNSNPISVSYRAALAGFVFSLALALLSLLDFRRGFLFSTYLVRTPFFLFNPIQALMLLLAAGGMWTCYRALRRVEAASDAPKIKPLTLVVLTLLVLDLFAYRAVPAARSMVSGRISADWLRAFGVTEWWQPFAEAGSYLANVWHATMLGILLSGLALTTLPLYIGGFITRPGFRGSLAEALFALPQPFCSCCSSVMAPSFVKRGASTNLLLSFVVGAPMLNVATAILAMTFLPPVFAVARIAAAIIISVMATYLVACVADRWDKQVVPVDQRDDGWIRGFGGRYLSWLDVDRVVRDLRFETPSQFLRAWLRASGRIALILVPTFWAWGVIASAIFRVLPSAFDNTLGSVVLMSVAGTFFMISTWSEIPMVLP